MKYIRLNLIELKQEYDSLSSLDEKRLYRTKLFNEKKLNELNKEAHWNYLNDAISLQNYKRNVNQLINHNKNK